MNPRPLHSGRALRSPRRRLRLLAPVVAVVGLVAGLGGVDATAASATGMRPAFTWSGPHTVPGATTNTSNAPAVGGLCFISGEGSVDGPCGTTVMWRNAATNAVDYKVATTSALTSWGTTAAVTSAKTSATPAFTEYYDIYGNYGPFAAWKGQRSNQQVWYAANTGGGWSPQTTIPGAATNDAPAVFLPYYLYVMFVTWTGTNGDVYYSWGTPGSTKGVDTFTWSKPAAVPGASTDAAPAVAEATTNVDEGRMFVFWKGTTDDEIWYSSIADPYISKNTWAKPAAMTSGSPRTSAGPSAAGVGTGLMVAYRGKTGSSIWYEQLSGGLVWGAQHQLAGASTTTGPGLADGVLAATQSSGAVDAYTF